MKLLTISALIIFIHSFIAYSQDSLVQINSYDIQTKIEDSSSSLDVNLLCKIKVKKKTDKFRLLFNSETNIKSVKCVNAAEEENINYEFLGQDTLVLINPEYFDASKKYSLIFDYSFPTGKFNDTIMYLGRGERWYPLIMNQIVPFHLRCEVPDKYSVISAGNLSEIDIEKDKKIFVWDSDFPVFKISFIVFNPLNYKHKSIDKVEFYYSSLEDSSAEKIINKENQMINYFDNLLGSFPYKKLTMFEINNFPGVNTCSGLLMTGTKTLQFAKKGFDDMLLLTTAQEWFGANVFGKFNEKGFFIISLSLPHYLRLMFIRIEKGETVFKKALMFPFDNYKKFAGSDNDIPIIDVDYPNTKEKGLILYGKGPYIFYKIEQKMGKVNWIKFLKNLYRKYHGKILTLNYFKEELGNIDRGEALSLFNKLITEKGISEE